MNRYRWGYLAHLIQLEASYQAWRKDFALTHGIAPFDSTYRADWWRFISGVSR